MAKPVIQFVCENCGASFGQWFGKCPECGEWESLKKFQDISDKSTNSKQVVGKAVFQKISETNTEARKRMESGIKEVDRVLGGGFMPDEVVLVSGEPGVGKSTLLLSIAGKIAANGKAACYCSAEEDAGNIAHRAKRLGIAMDQVLFTSEKQIESVLSAIQDMDVKPEFVVFDSLQTLYSVNAEGLPGSLVQSKEVLTAIIMAAKENHFVALVVGHITKEGDIAGPKYLEHMVDAVLFLEGDRHSTIRILRSFKNRYGGTDETGFFSMTEAGIEEVANPSAFFLDWNESAPGKAAVGVREGARIVFATIEVLAVSSSLAFPKRVTKGIDAKRFELILAILKKHLRAPVDQYDLFANVSGGLKVTDPLADLGIAAAVHSALMGDTPPEKSVYVGELGLLGAVRASRDIQQIVREARRVGFTTIYTSKEIPKIQSLRREKR